MSFDPPSCDIPAIKELAGLPHWVCWDAQKRPFNPNGGPASSTNARTWGTFDAAVTEAIQWKRNQNMQGVGFVFSAGDGYAGIDLDKCIDAKGEIAKWAKEIVEQINSYTEYSPSKNGLHIIAKCDLSLRAGKRKGGLEVYTQSRYFTVTGNHVTGTPDSIHDRTQEIESLLSEHFKGEVFTDLDVDPTAEIPFDKFEALRENSPKFKKTWDHKRDDFTDKSLSSYDFSLVLQAQAAGWTDDELVALIVAHRRKYGENEDSIKKALRKDYLANTIGNARVALDKGLKDTEALSSTSIQSARDASPEDILSEISGRLNVPVDKVIKRGSEPGEFYFVIEGREVSLGEAEDLLKVSRVQARILDSTHTVIKIKQKDWMDLIELIVSIAEFDNTGGIIEEMRACVATYLESRDIYSEAEIKDALLNEEPFRKEGVVWFRKEQLRRFIKIYEYFPRMTPKKLENLLKQAGFTCRQEKQRIKDKPIGRYYWGGGDDGDDVES